MKRLCYVEIKYLLTTKTGAVARAETEAAVHCVLTGSLGNTAPLQLTQSLAHHKPFCRAQVVHSHCDHCTVVH